MKLVRNDIYWNINSNGDIFPIDVIDKYVIDSIDSTVQLKNVPVVGTLAINKIITALNSDDVVRDFVEIFNGSVTQPNQFKFNYTTNEIQFHESQKGKEIIIKCMSEGGVGNSAKNVYMAKDSVGSIGEDVDGAINEINKQVSSLQESVTVISTLKNEVDEARQGEKSLSENIDKIKESVEQNSHDIEQIVPYIITKKIFLVKDNEWADVLQQCINIYKKVYIPDGEYNLNKEVVLPSGTELIMSNNAKLNRTSSKGKMFVTEYTNSTTKYNGASGIKIKGGIINHGSRSNYVSIITLFHAKDVIINGVTFLDTQGSHTIDIIGCENVVINNCKIKGYKSDESAYFRESIQIDVAFASATGFNTDITPIDSQCYDGTRCKTIYITNNIFEESSTNPPPLNAIGTHTQFASEEKGENVYIYNNVIKGNGCLFGYGNAIRLIQMKNVYIEGNNITNVMRGVLVDNSNIEYTNNGTSQDSQYGNNENIHVTNNTIETCVGDDASIRPIEVNCNNVVLESGRVVNHKNILINNNVLLNLSNTNSIRIETLSNSHVNNNVIIGGSGAIIIYSDNCSNVTTLNNKCINNSGINFSGGKINGCCDFIDSINIPDTITTNNSIVIGASDNSSYKSLEVIRNNNNVPYKARFGIGSSVNFQECLSSIELYNDTTKSTISRVYLTPKGFIPSLGTEDGFLNIGDVDYRWNTLYCNKVNLLPTSTSNRPVGVTIGTMIYDTTINKPIYWNGSKWVDAMGNNV